AVHGQQLLLTRQPEVWKILWKLCHDGKPTGISVISVLINSALNGLSGHPGAVADQNRLSILIRPHCCTCPCETSF
ncbi:hypothetical protein, partial [Mesorhizobium sp. M1378]|uniref:hypothetical protein n=1 Tax=Mesorhizobium sp. M1378 TaxID=2957092 RepID=UPI00333B33A5